MSELLETKVTEVTEETTLPDLENDLEAEKCMEAIKSAQEDKKYWKDWYGEKLKQVNESCDLIIMQNEIQLFNYFGSVPHKAAKASESYALPSGKLVLKDQEPEYERDEKETIKWLKENGLGQYVKTTESLDWQGLKGTLNVLGETVATSDGRVIPTIRAIPRDRVFKIELKKEG